VPQNRERIYFIGILKKYNISPYKIPKEKPLKDILKFIDYNDNTKEEVSKCFKYYVKNCDFIFTDLGFIRYNYTKINKNICSTLMTTGMLWCKPMHRRANVKEYLALQGFPISFKQVVSNTQLKKQIGNSMSVNVLVEIFKEIFRCVKF
jgi:DNA (cytosine-5)-methyltransferase 1